MVCKKCGKENESGVNFCAYCGGNLNDAQPEKVAAKKETKKPNVFLETLLSGLNTLKGYFLKPTNSIDETSNDVKKVAIIGGILTVAMMIFNLIMSMLGSIIEGSLFNGTFGIEFSNIEDLNYLNLLLTNLFIYAIVMLVIAGIFYVGSLVVKKEVKYTKFLTIVFITAIPFMVGTVGVATILRFIYSELQFIVVVISTIYSIALFTNLVNKELKLENMTKIIYNAACYSTIVIISYYVIANIIESNILSVFGGV